MGLRFRKSIRLAPGVRMNLGLRGLSMTLGPRGSSINIGPRGTYSNVGIPGTGISTRTRMGGRPSRRASDNSAVRDLQIAFRLQEDGTVDIVGEDGEPLPARLIKIARVQNEGRLRDWLQEKCDHWNKGITGLLGIHLETPPPDRPAPDARRRVFEVPCPSVPEPIRLTLLARIFRSRRERIDRLNTEAMIQYENTLASWQRACDEHEKLENARLAMFDPSIPPDPAEAHEYLSEVLGRIEWPRETTISLEVDDALEGVLVDVDLPEIEDMPDKEATVAARGLRLNIKDRTATQRRREYMTHVYGVAFRIISEIFAALPRIERVAASGFSQRASKTTGQVSDEYLFSVRVPRSGWARLDFANLADLDLPSCFGTFDIRRKISVTGVFTPIEPYTSLEDTGV